MDMTLTYFKLAITRLKGYYENEVFQRYILKHTVLFTTLQFGIIVNIHFVTFNNYMKIRYSEVPFTLLKIDSK